MIVSERGFLLGLLSSLKMEKTYCSETSTDFQLTTWRYTELFKPPL
jgi:hypothetical protein